MEIEAIPIEPACFVVLIVRVIISELRLQELVSGSEHRRSVRKEQEATKILRLLSPQFQHVRRRIIVTFPTAIPTVVFLMAVLVVFAVGHVVPTVISDLVVKRKSIMRVDVVDALVRVAGLHQCVWEQIIATIQASHHFGHQPLIASHKAANFISEFAVPLKPAFSRK